MVMADEDTGRLMTTVPIELAVTKHVGSVAQHTEAEKSRGTHDAGNKPKADVDPVALAFDEGRKNPPLQIFRLKRNLVVEERMPRRQIVGFELIAIWQA
jgi:hypothetical protein